MSDEIGVKRFYVPGIVLEEKCPECGKMVTKDLSGDYISYPSYGVNEIPFYCYTETDDDDVEHDFSVKYEIKIDVVKVAE